jgi:CHASE2 domain-containing sensor protein
MIAFLILLELVFDRDRRDDGWMGFWLTLLLLTVGAPVLVWLAVRRRFGWLAAGGAVLATVLVAAGGFVLAGWWFPPVAGLVVGLVAWTIWRHDQRTSQPRGLPRHRFS